MRSTVSQPQRRRACSVWGTARLWGWMTEPVNRAAPEKARRGPARVRTSAVHAGAEPNRWSRSPTTEASTGDWSTQVVARRCGNGASRRIKWTATAFQAVVMTLARTAIMVPADPAKAAAVGTTQKLALGVTAHASSELWPALRSPRDTRVAPRRSHMPADNARGPSNWLTEVSLQAATRESVADVARICTRRKTGHARCTAGPPCAEPQPTSPPTMNHTRVSTPRLWPLPRPARTQLTHGGDRIRCPDAPSTD